HRLDHRAVDLVGRQLRAELLDDVDRPFLRAHAEHVARGRVLPRAAVGGHDVLAGLIPGLLGVHEDPVQVENNGGQAARISGFWRRALSASASRTARIAGEDSAPARQATNTWRLGGTPVSGTITTPGGGAVCANRG